MELTGNSDIASLALDKKADWTIKAQSAARFEVVRYFLRKSGIPSTYWKGIPIGLWENFSDPKTSITFK
jgi:hypothetical protein